MLKAEHAAALPRLIAVAKSDTGQSKICADFLLSWWNAGQNGGFDLTDLWSVDPEIRADMLAVIAHISESRGEYPAEEYRDDFEQIIKRRRRRRAARQES